jgi:hypothetical protein
VDFGIEPDGSACLACSEAFKMYSVGIPPRRMGIRINVLFQLSIHSIQCGPECTEYGVDRNWQVSVVQQVTWGAFLEFSNEACSTASPLPCAAQLGHTSN